MAEGNENRISEVSALQVYCSIIHKRHDVVTTEVSIKVEDAVYTQWTIYSVTRKKEMLSFATIQMVLKQIMLSEVS